MSTCSFYVFSLILGCICVALYWNFIFSAQSILLKILMVISLWKCFTQKFKKQIIQKNHSTGSCSHLAVYPLIRVQCLWPLFSQYMCVCFIWRIIASVLSWLSTRSSWVMWFLHPSLGCVLVLLSSEGVAASIHGCALVLHYPLNVNIFSAFLIHSRLVTEKLEDVSIGIMIYYAILISFVASDLNVLWITVQVIYIWKNLVKLFVKI